MVSPAAGEIKMPLIGAHAEGAVTYRLTREENTSKKRIQRVGVKAG